VSASRYAGAKPLTYTSPKGVRVRYLPPRVLPQVPPPGAPGAPSGYAAVAATERHRLDLVAQRTLRDPLLAWRIGDANAAMDPFALVAVPGTLLAIPPVGL
jgi:hypothetical protein